MNTLLDRYPYARIGEVETLAYMSIWDKCFCVAPVPVVAPHIPMSQYWLSVLCCNRELISIKISGVWFVALYPVQLHVVSNNYTRIKAGIVEGDSNRILTEDRLNYGTSKFRQCSRFCEDRAF